MTTKNIIIPAQALILETQAHPNWYRNAADLKTSVLASLPTNYAEYNPPIIKIIKLGVQHIAEGVLGFNKKISDKNAFVLEKSDLPTLLRMNPYIQTILLPSDNDESGSYWSFIKYLDENKIRHTLPKKVKDGESFLLNCNRQVECIIANSTSRAILGANHATLLNQFKKAIAS